MSNSAKHLHIVSFDVPFPPDYGGAIDIYYKLLQLKEFGVKIILHCFEYGRKQQNILEEICEKVIYYERKTFVNPFADKLPYIVSTRSNDALLQDLLKDDFPILFEGLHSCFYLDNYKLKHRKKFVRTHNIEHDYYTALYKKESKIFKKYFFKYEAKRLEEYEQVMNFADYIFAISPADKLYLEKKYSNVLWLPPFHGNEKCTSLEGMGDYILYHGNLGISENDEAACYIVETLWKHNNLPLFIAGKNPSKKLLKLIDATQNVALEKNTSPDYISQLINNAQINLLFTFQPTGIKLKLVNALYNGRFCIANSFMVKNTMLEDACYVCDTAAEQVKLMHELFRKKFTEENISDRKKILKQNYSDEKNIKVLIDLI